MADTKWMIRGREFGHCNCAYGCPCQFNALPTYGDCKAVVGMQIDEGYHGSTRLDGLRTTLVLAWPGPIHEGNGQASIIIDRRASAPHDPGAGIPAVAGTSPGRPKGPRRGPRRERVPRKSP